MNGCTQVDDDSDSENEGWDKTAAAAAIASSSSDGVIQTGTGMSAVSLHEAVDKVMPVGHVRVTLRSFFFLSLRL